MREPSSVVDSGSFVWTIFTSAGLLIGTSLALALAGFVEAIVGMILVTPVTLAIAGSTFGLAQAAVLRRSKELFIRWVIANMLAFAFGMTAGVVVVELVGHAVLGQQLRLSSATTVERIVGLTIIGLSVGISVGVAQRLAVHRLPISTSGWIGRSALGFGLGMPLGGLISEIVGGPASSFGFVLFLAAAGAIVGVATADIGRRAAYLA